MSKLKKPLLDSVVFIQYKKKITPNIIGRMKLSMVVLYELAATTIDKDYLQMLDGIRRTFYQKDDLLVPPMTDWWETAKMIRRLRFGEKTASKGKTPKMSNAHRLQNDALIARSASLNDCFIVTTNTADFNSFVPFMEKLEVVSADEFFA